jgi:hypothetical protein
MGQRLEGDEPVGEFAKTANSRRWWCTRCGGHLMNEHPVWGAIVGDGLPTQRDLPGARGGTDTLMAA